eukprot:2955112-Prymnesium_polylepis.1
MRKPRNPALRRRLGWPGRLYWPAWRRLLRKLRRHSNKLSLHDTIAAAAAANPLASPPPPCPPSVHVRTIPGRGRSLLAARAFNAGDVILAEQPLVAVPMTGGGHPLACAHCLAFLGSARDDLDLAAGRVDATEASALCTERSSSTCACACGALYCSAACHRADESRGHRLLCPSGAAAAAWQRFRAHAQEEAELPEVELAAALLAVIVMRTIDDDGAEVGGRTGDGGGARTAAVALGLVQEPIEVVLGRDAAGAEAAAHTLRDIRTSCALLRAALLLSCGDAGVAPRHVRRLARMSGLNSFGNLVGLAFLNQVAVTVPSAACTLVQGLAAALAPAPARQEA